MGLNLEALQKLSTVEIQQILTQLQPKLNKYIIHTPTVKQTVFMNLGCREAFFGGAAGGGKSDALLMDVLQNVDVKNYAGILFRKSFADLVKPGALINRAKEWLAPYTQTGEVRWAEKDRRFEFLDAYGKHRDIRSIVQFGYLENENDKYNYQGGEYQYAGFDELVHMSKTNYLYLFSRMRRLRGMNVPIKVRGASNPPDDAQGQWVYHRFVNPKSKEKGTIFIPAGLDDNPYLDKEEYTQALDVLDSVTRARLKDGVWTIKRSGNMFKRDWFEVVDSVPPYRRTVRSWDMASTDPEKDKKRRKTGDPDYTATVKLSEASGVYYIEDVHACRKRPKDTEALQHNTAKADGYGVKQREEQEPGSSGIGVISLKSRSLMRGFDYKGIRSSGSKVTRASAVSSAAEMGNIKILRGCRGLDLFFDQLESFPSPNVHDDLVDALSLAFNEIRNLPCEELPIPVGEGHESYWGEGDVIPIDVHRGRIIL